MDKERIRNIRERLNVQNDQLSSLHLKLSSCTVYLSSIYVDIEGVQNHEVEDVYSMIRERNELELVADQLIELAKFISTTAGVVGYDAAEILNSSKSTDDK